LSAAIAKPSVKQHLAAIRQLFDYLVAGGVLVATPAGSVRGPKFVVTRGKTPVLSGAEMRKLLKSIDTGVAAASVVAPRSRFGAARYHLATPLRSLFRESSSTQGQQLALACERQRIWWFDHRQALTALYRPDVRSKKSRSTTAPAELLVEFGQLTFAQLIARTEMIGEGPRHRLHQSFLPRVDLMRMDAEPSSELGDRCVLAQCGKCNFGLESGIVFASAC
jgi:hypothetical protein